MNSIFNKLDKPKLYEESTDKFWDDPYISQNMLEAHLNPTFDAASRSFTFMDASVEWISKLAPVHTHPDILDLGCGPGLYADRLNQLGYQVTGVDFSKRSIEYAKSINQNNTYIYLNYLNIQYDNQFDIVLLIYCDYAVLPKEDRISLLRKVKKALKPGGIFIFDVFTPHRYKDIKETTNWSLNKEKGFFKPKPYISLNAHFVYPNHVHCDQHVILTDDGEFDIYRIWDTAFNKESITEELKLGDFNEVEFYRDVAGDLYDKEYDTMCMVVRK